MRIDKYFSEKYGSRTKAAEAVQSGLVLVNGKKVAPSYDVKDSDVFTFINAEESFVSAGGYKLSKALKDFGVSVEGIVFADVGASTGGFTDCLLQNGAKKVYCIDVGESQLFPKLREQNVVIIDNFNARNLSKELFADKIGGVTVDVSFISLTYILGGVAEIAESGAYVFALIKPQFECESSRVGKNGIVKGEQVHKRIITKIYNFAVSVGLAPIKLTNAPICREKNLEYVILLKKDGESEKIENLLKCVKL